jgi:anti-anti-sigma regulatory factor
LPREAARRLYTQQRWGASARLRQIFTTLGASHDRVVADLSETLFIDSTIILALWQADEQAQRVRSRFCLQLGTVAIVAKALEITHLLERLEHYPTREEAVDPRASPAITFHMLGGSSD